MSALQMISWETWWMIGKVLAGWSIIELILRRLRVRRERKTNKELAAEYGTGSDPK